MFKNEPHVMLDTVSFRDELNGGRCPPCLEEACDLLEVGGWIHTVLTPCRINTLSENFKQNVR